jgi:hypothetical protein
MTKELCHTCCSYPYHATLRRFLRPTRCRLRFVARLSRDCSRTVNLGDDADTTGAVYGQLAGAFYGYDAIPPQWRDKIAKRKLILQLADALCSSP